MINTGDTTSLLVVALILTIVIQEAETFPAILQKHMAALEEVGSLGYTPEGRPREQQPRRDFFLLGDELVSVHRNGLRDKQRLWPGAVVPYTISRDYPRALKDKIRQAMDEIENDVSSSSGKCVQFVPRTDQRNYLEITRQKGCHSIIGFYNMGRQQTALGPGCEEKGVIMHELLHVLGFYHEQNRYDRDGFVMVNLTNVNEKGKRDFGIRNNTDPHGVPYDMESIMHYGPYTMAANKTYPVLTPIPELARGQLMGQRYALTRKDVIKIQRQYSCPEDTSHIHSDISEQNVYTTCTFEYGICDLQMAPASGNVTEWIRTSQLTPDGPKAGHTNGLDYFMYVSSDPRLMSRLNNSQLNKSTDEEASRTHSPQGQGSHEVPSADHVPAPPALGETLNVHKVTHREFSASFFTPLIKSEGSFTCLNLAVYQKGPSAAVRIIANGPMFLRQTLTDYTGYYQEKWTRVRLSIPMLPGIHFQLQIEAFGHEGAVAVDDLYILKTKCP